MKHLAWAFATALAAAAAPAMADEALAKARNCMACHAMDKRLVGSSYKDVARKYAPDVGAAVDKLVQKVLKGGSGVWGVVPMPPNAGVNDAEARKLVAWILTLE